VASKPLSTIECTSTPATLAFKPFRARTCYASPEPARIYFGTSLRPVSLLLIADIGHPWASVTERPIALPPAEGVL
jgi:hypothetical protein